MKTREEALRRFKAAKQKKMNAVAALEEKMKQAYEERTGMKANYVVTLWTAFPFTQLMHHPHRRQEAGTTQSPFWTLVLHVWAQGTIYFRSIFPERWRRHWELYCNYCSEWQSRPQCHNRGVHRNNLLAQFEALKNISHHPSNIIHLTSCLKSLMSWR